MASLWFGSVPISLAWDFWLRRKSRELHGAMFFSLQHTSNFTRNEFVQFKFPRIVFLNFLWSCLCVFRIMHISFPGIVDIHTQIWLEAQQTKWFWIQNHPRENVDRFWRRLLPLVKFWTYWRGMVEDRPGVRRESGKGKKKVDLTRFGMNAMRYAQLQCLRRTFRFLHAASFPSVEHRRTRCLEFSLPGRRNHTLSTFEAAVR